MVGPVLDVQAQHQAAARQAGPWGEGCIDMGWGTHGRWSPMDICWDYWGLGSGFGQQRVDPLISDMIPLHGAPGTWLRVLAGIDDLLRICALFVVGRGDPSAVLA